MKVVIGYDTSCYTTSVAAVTLEGDLIGQYRQVLSVDQGERGLQQSKGVFQHIHHIPSLIQEAVAEICPQDIVAVCVSSKPRPIENSYMPVFTVGVNIARVTSFLLNIPLYMCSHQEGHIMVGLWSAGGPLQSEFLAIHLSGGTTEIVKVRRGEMGMDIQLLGGTLDLHAGQFVDRIGVALRLPFPAGPSLEKLARTALTRGKPLSSWVKGTSCSFSGAESQAQRYIKEGMKGEEVALETFLCIARTIVKMIKNAWKETGLNHILLVGGVASNQIIREYLVTHLKKEAANIQVFFSAPQFSTDNAVGVALLGVQAYKAVESGQQFSDG
jgi:N6-L-threonylcarbamoyladenine synthase